LNLPLRQGYQSNGDLTVWQDKRPCKIFPSLLRRHTTFKTLETGCESDWHFVDPSRVEIGLNHDVYTLKKQ
jgi:hypothetical protein